MAESSKSAGSADSYIGSLISLTSKCEIRYEGVLYNIDTENSTIGLQNVSSYGTEGRKKDGQQIPPSDKVYEYILFCGSDIKDLQVKSTPPIQTERQIHSDPAIIQSHYACAPSVSSTSAPVGGGEPSALPRTTYPNVLPTYQPGAHLGSWGSSSAIQNADGTSISTPMNWQRYYDSSNGLPHAQQQSIPFQPLSTVPVPLVVQNQLRYPEVQAHLSSNMINMSERVAPVPPLIPTANVVPSNFSPVPTPAHFSTPSTTDITSSLSVKTSLPSHRAPTTANVLNMSPLPSYNQVTNVVSAPIYGKVGSAPTIILPTQSVPYSASFISGSTSGPLLTISPTLLTPNQLTQPGPPLPSSTRILYPNQNDMEVPILASSNPSTSVSNPLFQVPLLPLPLSSQQLDESVGNSRSSNGEVRVSHAVAPQHPAPQFTEEFDFTAMNEKFKKDEVWGKLGKAKKRDKTEGTEHNPGPNIGGGGEYDQVPKFDTKPVYIKDEFFDTLSCNSPARGGRNGQSRFSERMKLDTETFGDFEQRPYLGHGGRFIGRGGNYRGSYNRGRGYGYSGSGSGSGRGGHMPF